MNITTTSEQMCALIQDALKAQPGVEHAYQELCDKVQAPWYRHLQARHFKIPLSLRFFSYKEFLLDPGEALVAAQLRELWHAIWWIAQYEKLLSPLSTQEIIINVDSYTSEQMLMVLGRLRLSLKTQSPAADALVLE